MNISEKSLYLQRPAQSVVLSIGCHAERRSDGNIASAEGRPLWTACALLTGVGVFRRTTRRALAVAERPPGWPIGGQGGGPIEWSDPSAQISATAKRNRDARQVPARHVPRPPASPASGTTRR